VTRAAAGRSRAAAVFSRPVKAREVSQNSGVTASATRVRPGQVPPGQHVAGDAVEDQHHGDLGRRDGRGGEPAGQQAAPVTAGVPPVPPEDPRHRRRRAGLMPGHRLVPQMIWEPAAG
jgi:hypothetical protein